MTDPMIAYVLSSGMATLHEVDTVYSLEDVYKLYEIIKVREYNEWKYHDLIRQKNEIKKKMGIR